MEAARKRFEEQIYATNAANKQTQEEYFDIMHESTKLAKLKEINKQQERLLNRTIIEEQMEVERHRKAISREGRRERTNLSIGPQMTDEVYEFSK